MAPSIDALSNPTAKRINLIVNILLILYFIASLVICYLAKISPQVHWVLGFVSFLVPLVLALNAIIFCVFLFTRRLLLGMSALVLIINLNYFIAAFGHFDLNIGEKSSDGVSLNVITHNLGSFDFDSIHLIKKYASLVGLNENDVICFQEFAKTDIDSTIQKFIKYAELSGYTAYFSGARMAPRDVGLLILSKYPLVDSGQIPFGSNHYNGVNFVDILLQNDTIRVYNIHLNSSSVAQAKSIRYAFYLIRHAMMERSSHIDAIMDHIVDSPYPAMLLGDLNEHPFGYIYNYVVSFLTDSYTSSFHFNPSTHARYPVRIDYVFFDDHFSFQQFRILKQSSFSDHLPVTASLDLKNKINY